MSEVTDALQVLYRERARLIIFALTGRTGSGCTTASKLLTKELEGLALPIPQTHPSHPEERKYRILHKFISENWTPFTRVSMTVILLSFILKRDEQEFSDFLKKSFEKKIQSEDVAELQEVIKRAREGNLQTLALLDNSPISLSSEQVEQAKSLVTSSLEPILDEIRRKLKSNYIPVFQAIGDNLRRSGSPYSELIGAQNIYSIARRADWAIQVITRFDEQSNKPTRIVLDAMRNPFEALYFRDRYAAYYLLAINAEDEHREARLSAHFSKTEIERFDEKEYPKKKRSKSSTYEAYISQDIQSCIEKADVHIHNPGLNKPSEDQDFSKLATTLMRYVSLAIHPGLVNPTRSERCMQIAYSAKLNSGCISRQVGAVVTDVDGAVKSVGWNDVPFGQVPCLLRDVRDLLGNNDKGAFSDFELADRSIRDQLKKAFPLGASDGIGGRSCPFCFKDAFNEANKTQDRSMTRSLHAEENAFLQISKSGGAGLKGGHLYTTASPCELCSKKAYQLGIAEIWYVDPYPGVSRKQILGSGKFRPNMNLFSGAIGDAYHRLYDPLMASKDETNAFVNEAAVPISLFPATGGKKKA
ncbi:MAG: hypothetical protein JNM76_07535 [Betaproteobacteria bacterium]|nr:hypothetical protein [Betaproteobacteria bacterium]